MFPGNFWVPGEEIRILGFFSPGSGSLSTKNLAQENLNLYRTSNLEHFVVPRLSNSPN